MGFRMTVGTFLLYCCRTSRYCVINICVTQVNGLPWSDPSFPPRGGQWSFQSPVLLGKHKILALTNHFVEETRKCYQGFWNLRIKDRKPKNAPWQFFPKFSEFLSRAGATLLPCSSNGDPDHCSDDDGHHHHQYQYHYYHDQVIPEKQTPRARRTKLTKLVYKWLKINIDNHCHCRYIWFWRWTRGWKRWRRNPARAGKPQKWRFQKFYRNTCSRVGFLIGLNQVA